MSNARVLDLAHKWRAIATTKFLRETLIAPRSMSGSAPLLGPVLTIHKYAGRSGRAPGTRTRLARNHLLRIVFQEESSERSTTGRELINTLVYALPKSALEP